ncbi:MAG: prolyl oligopeptidase family serine peptidase [Ignavibacteriaceae bacterium]|nr:prolyl oligopeptidase family serine peptidase [Ignavibacteriaceae bacterium]
MKIVISIFLAFFMMTTSLFSQLQKQTSHTFEKEIKLTLSANYLLYLPKDYEKVNDEFPLVLFLHGAGERGTDVEKVKVHGLPRLINEGKDFPFIVVSPQCPEDMFWNTDLLTALLDEIEDNYRVDKNRIYVTGLSMGGHGTWSLAIAQPHRFAAIAPVCGWSNPTMACTIKHVPIWVFHGAKDNVVPLSASEQMVEKLKSCNADVKFTIYPEANHDSWTETYNNDELYSWLLQHSLK